MISVIIPVLHESAIINSTIDHIHEISRSHAYEIIAVDGCTTQDTIRYINDRSVIKVRSDKGRAVQMNAGASHAHGNILLFLHADTRLPHNAFSQISQALAHDNTTAGAFGLTIDSSNVWLKFIAFLTTMRSRITRIPYGDQAIFVKKDYFFGIGSFKDIPLMEDVELMKNIKKHKGNICILRENALTSSRRWDNNGYIKTTFLNRLIRMLYSFGVNPHILEKKYYKN